jgi:hypothetical protein
LRLPGWGRSSSGDSRGDASRFGDRTARILARFAAVSRDGDIFETFESAVPDWSVGDPVILAGKRHFRITATIPIERMAEFTDEPLYAVLEVEPL